MSKVDAAGVRLRRATGADAAALLEWRNDPATRAASFEPRVIEPDEHRAWLERKLADERCALLVVEVDGTAVGQVRLELCDDETKTAEIHVGLAAQARGRSIGRTALRLAVRSARDLVGAERIVARVKSDNEASLAAFRAAGFAFRGTDGDVVELVAAAGG